MLKSSSVFRLFFSAARPKCYDYRCPDHYKPRYGYEDKECDKDGCRDDDCCEKECELIISFFVDLFVSILVVLCRYGARVFQWL